MLSTLRAEGPPLLYLDGGDLLFGPPSVRLYPQRDLLREKARLEARAAVRMGVGAVNIGRTDLADGLALVEQLGKEPGVPWVSTNLRKKGGGYPFPRWRILSAGGKRIAVFGLIRPDPRRDEQVGVEISDPVEAAKEALKELSGKNVVVCLSNLGLEEERKLALAVPGIDYMVGGGSRELLTVPESVGESLLLHAGEEGKYLGLLEVTGATPPPHRLITLDTSVGEAADVAEWVAAHKKAQESWTPPQGAPRLPPPNGKPQAAPPANPSDGSAPGAKEKGKSPDARPGDTAHAGTEACRSCHPREHRAWSETPHARAYASLKGNVQDARCLGCHSTVLRRPDGAKVEPAVACEACHGPGAAHAVKGSIVRRPAEAVCLACHRGFHEKKKFDWGRAYDRVRCDRDGTRQTRRRAGATAGG